MNRRQFVVASALAASTCALGASSARADEGSASSASSESELAAGTFTATAAGRNGDLTITATFSDGRLVSLETSHSESKNIGDSAVELLTQRAIQSQCLNLDSITGATLTSAAFMQALTDVYEQAGADTKALAKSPSNLKPAEDIDEECDVAIIGTGGAAFAAAVTAAEAGKSVVMIDKMDIIGGNTNCGEGVINAPDPERQEPMGIEDSVEHYFNDTFEGGDETADPELVQILAENSLDAVHWMEDHGLHYVDEVFTAIGGKWQRGHEVAVEVKGEQGGAYYVSCLRACADTLGVKVYTDAKAEHLLANDAGEIIGVEGSRPSSGASVKLTAKSVILATGGYARNAELAMQYDKRVTKDMPSSCNVSATGDAIPMAQEVGAGLKNMELVQIHPLGDPQNGGVATFVGNWMSIEEFVFVNDEGKRFTAEDGRRDEISNAELEQTNKEMWLLVDSSAVDDSRLNQIDNLVETGHSFRSDDIADLADQIGVPADNLVETIEDYNACVEAGQDTMVNPGKELLGDSVFDTPPFYASKRIPTIHYTMGGVAIDSNAQVCKEDGTPIPGLFAAGECTGGIQGANRLGGNSFTDIIVFGRIAGASAASNAQ
jgi:urocanate reductase